MFLLVLSSAIVAAPIWYGSGNDAGLVGKWSCEGNFKDSSGQGNNGTQSGGVTITDGYKGRGCGFDGMNDAINISKTAVASSNLSMFMWIRPTSMPVRMGLIDITVKNFFEVGNGRIEVYGYEFGTPQWINGAAVTVNTWQHVGFTWNGTSLRIYQDGVDTGGSNSLTGNMYYTGVESTIGARMIVSGDRWFNGTIDEVRIYNRTLSASEVLTLYNTSKSYTLKFKSTPTKGISNETPAPEITDNSGLVGWWKMDDLTNGNTTDSSGQGNNGSVIGAALTSNGRWNNAYNFDGLNDYINITHSASININGNISVCAWYKWNGAPTSEQIIASKGWYGDATYSWALYFYPLGGYVRFYMQNLLNNSIYYFPAGTQNQWHHLCGTFNGTTGIVYWDSMNGTYCTSCAIQTNTYPMTMGKASNSAQGYYLNGSIDEVRIYNRTLSASEVKELYLSKGLVGYWKMDADQRNTTDTYDSSGYYNHGKITGAVLTNEGRFKEGYKFDGTYDSMNTSTAMTSMINQTFTYSAWVKSLEPSAGHRIIAKYDGGGSDNGAITLDTYNNIRCLAIGTGAGTSSATSATALQTNKWEYLTCVFNGTHMSLYRNGAYVSIGDAISSFAGSTDYNVKWTIGQDNDGGDAENWNGTIDEVRIYNRALSDSEVAGLYNGTKSNKIVFKSMPSITSLSNETPTPTSSNETGLVGWYQMENNANDLSGQGNNGIVVGAVANVTGRWNNALNFTGNGKYINYSAPASLDIEQAGTISAWIKPLSRTAGGYAVLVRASGGNWEDERLFFGLRYATNWMQCALANGTSYVAPIDLVSHNLSRWYHVACTWNGTLISMYNDGVFTTSSAYAFTPEMTGYSLYTSSNFGAWTSLEGAVDEIRIYNRSLSAAEIQELYLSKGLVGKWTFNADERNTTDTYDSSGYYNHGKITGAVLTNEGRFKEGYKFDGNDRIWTPLVYDLDTENYTFSAWIKAADLAHNQYTIFGGAEGGVAGNYWALIHRTDKSGVTLQYANGTGMPALFITPSQNLVANKTSHIAMVRGQGSNVKLYQDGVQISDQNMTYVGFENCNITIGQDGAGGSPWVGMIDEARVYNRALSPTEISQLYNGTKSTKLVWKSVPG